MGGRPLSRGALFHILQSRLYVGEIVHKEKVHAGQHQAIVERDVFDAVQGQLRDNIAGHTTRKTRAAAAVLTGRVFDSAGRPMSPSCAYGKRRRLYRYYISLPLQVGGRAADVDGVTRVSGEGLESYVADQVRRLADLASIDTRDLGTFVRRVDLNAEATEIVLCARACFHGRNAQLALLDMRARLFPGEVLACDDAAQTQIRVRLPLRFQMRGGRTWQDGRRQVGERKEVNVGLRAALRSAHSDLLDLSASPMTPREQLASAQAPGAQHARQVSRLAFLAPDLQAQVLRGVEPRALTLRAILKSELPLAWADQRALFASLA
jgi:hypothetical protein